MLTYIIKLLNTAKFLKLVFLGDFCGVIFSEISLLSSLNNVMALLLLFSFQFSFIAKAWDSEISN